MQTCVLKMRLSIIVLLILCVVGLSHSGFAGRHGNYKNARKTTKLSTQMGSSLLRSGVSRKRVAKLMNTGKTMPAKVSRHKKGNGKTNGISKKSKLSKIAKKTKPRKKFNRKRKISHKKPARAFKAKKSKASYKSLFSKAFSSAKSNRPKSKLLKFAQRISKTKKNVRHLSKAMGSLKAKILSKAKLKEKKPSTDKAATRYIYYNPMGNHQHPKPKQNAFSKILNKLKSKYAKISKGIKKIIKSKDKPDKCYDDDDNDDDKIRYISSSNKPTNALGMSNGIYSGYRLWTPDEETKQFVNKRQRRKRYDAVYNFGPFFFGRRYRLGRYRKNKQVREEIPLKGRKFKCTQQGVLKISLGNTTISTKRGRVLIDFIFRKPCGFAFNVGDSVSNNGEGGDDGDQSWNAEVVGRNGHFQAYLNDAESNKKALDINHFYYRRATVIIGDGALVWRSERDRHFNFMIHEGLFGLNDQFDANGEENFDIYLGINRAIKEGTSNKGFGLCSVGIKFLPVATP